MRTRTSSNGLPARLRTFAAREGLLPPGCRVLCAVSGGADSMALLTALRALAPDLGISVAAAHFDHRLRGAESDRDRAFVADWCARHEIPLRLGHGDVRAAAAAQGRGLEETARDLRYAFLETAAADLGCDRIATAHNADDNAETVLLHLVRGTGLDGLVGIPPRRGALIRPLLGCTRAEIEAYLAAEGVPHVEDSSNADPAYARNRIRRDVMPVLRDLNPAFAATLAAALPHLRADRAYLDDKAAAALPLRRDGAGVRLSARAVREAPRPLAVRAVRRALAALGVHQTAAASLLAAVDLASAGPAAQRDLPGRILVRRDYDDLCFVPRDDWTAPAPFAPVPVPGPGTVDLPGGWRVTLDLVPAPADAAQSGAACHLTPPGWPLVLRPRQAGDRLRPPGRPEKSLKDWYIDEKLPRAQRAALPVLAGPDGTLLAAALLGPQADRCAAAGTTALRVRYTQTDEKRHTWNERTDTDV